MQNIPTDLTMLERKGAEIFLKNHHIFEYNTFIRHVYSLAHCLHNSFDAHNNLAKQGFFSPF